MEFMLELTIKIPVICSCEETCICRDLIKCKKSCFCGGIKQRLEKRSEYSASSPDYNFHKKIKKTKSVSFITEPKIRYIHTIPNSIKMYNIIRNLNLSPRFV